MSAPSFFSLYEYNVRKTLFRGSRLAFKIFPLIGIIHLLLLPVTLTLGAGIKSIIDYFTREFAKADDIKSSLKRVENINDKETKKLYNELKEYKPQSTSSVKLLKRLNNEQLTLLDEKEALGHYLGKDTNNGKELFNRILTFFKNNLPINSTQAPKPVADKASVLNIRDNSNFREKSPYSEIMKAVLQKDWQNNLAKLTANYSRKEKIKIIHLLFAHTKLDAAIWLINSLNIPDAQLVSVVFNGLKKDTDINNLYSYLKNQWEKYSEIAIINCNQLQPELKCSDYHRLDHSLQTLLQNNIYETELVEFHFSRFKKFQECCTSITTQNLFNNTLAIINKLSQLWTIYEQNKPQLDFFHQNLLIQQMNNNRLQQKQIDFSKAIRNGKIASISFQDIQELYPDDIATQNKMREQCLSYGVGVSAIRASL